MKKILIIGAGAMGSAFSIPCAENNNDVTIMGSVLEDDFISLIKFFSVACLQKKW